MRRRWPEEAQPALAASRRYLMWKDLTERTEQLRENAVVRHLIDTPRESYPSAVAFPDPRKLDTEFGPEQTFCPLPVDSSQLSAVMAAVRGKDFVLIGPPGTGKSQTIANLIAQCLAEGKRVLFVSEKIAALDVVYRRLREVGLGEFCLELHSSKARKLDVLAQLQKSWEAQGSIDPDAWRAEAQRLKTLRDQLNVYVEHMHLRYGNGLSIFEAIGRVVGGADMPVLGLSWRAANEHNLAAMDSMRELAELLEVNARAVGQGGLLNNPLSAIEHSDWSPGWQQRLINAARAVVLAAQTLEQAYGLFTQTVGLPRIPSLRRARGAVGVLARILPTVAGRDWRFVLRADIRTIVERLEQAKAMLIKHRDLSGQLAPQWPDSIVSACRRGLDLLQQRRETFERLAQPWPADVIEDMQKGLDWLDEIDRGTQQLSVQYSDQVEQLNVTQLQREWILAEKKILPLGWLGKRQIRKAFDQVVVGAGEPNVATDLDLLVKIRALRSAVSTLEIGPATDGIWAGLKTRPEFAQCALKLAEALGAARSEQPWEDIGFEPISTGRCGERLDAELKLMRRLKALDAELLTLAPIGPATAELWAGLATRAEDLEAALRFQAHLAAVRESGTLAGTHDAVARGSCGTAMSADFERLGERSLVEHKLEAFDDLRDMTAGLWDGLATRIDELETALKFSGSVSAVVANLAATPEAITAVKAPLDRLIGDGNALLERSGPIASAGEAYLGMWSRLQPGIDNLATLGSFSERSKTEFGDVALDDLIDRCSAILGAENRLNAWCAWRKVRHQAITCGLAPLVAGIENGAVAHGTFRRAFEIDYCRWWLGAVVDEDAVIRSFVSAVHEMHISDFRALDDKFTTLTRAWVRAGLCADLPVQDNVTRNSEWGVLKHEMNKKKRHMPLRELMTRIPSALTKLTPCLLMSPLSIAQYLAADATAFDVVVFDEASQIPVWDAVGAIARGKQVVMVGDPKQLPPTSFFDRAESDADDEDVEGDLESILDECMGANLPTMNLAWHYRSRAESLIAFSNHHYYGGSLVTFPSPVTVDGAVSFHYVKGVYEKGGARINKPEARALVDDLVGRLKSPGFRESKLTIGVVTFNAEQQTLIEDLLDEARRQDPSLESYFAEVELEPVFVKNLESVQGDERDIMYFSITYGPDLGGAVSMNFGPMNREGGERRLNVAITRARQELRVFSSLKAEQMDLARTQAIGVRDLKHFLDFAERGHRALAEATGGSRGDYESPFEEAVASALARRQWVLHSQVGASAFRIDLAVVHPDAPGTYLTGIECDGATYHRSATARDRDKLREHVLRGLGWEIVRVWSTDWWIDPSGTLDKLNSRLDALLEASRAKRTQDAENEAAKIAAAAVLAKAMDTAASKPTSPTPGRGVSQTVQHGDPEPSAGSGIDSCDDTPDMAEAYARNVGEVTNLPASFVAADPGSVADGIDVAAFYDDSYAPVLARMIAHVIDVEGPVLDSVLARRIARVHGWQRTGSRIQERVEALAAKTHLTTEEDVGTFYWATDRGPEKPIVFRHAEDDFARSVDEICMPELVALAKKVLLGPASEEDPIIVMARELGLQRLRAVSRGRFEKAMRLARLQ